MFRNPEIWLILIVLGFVLFGAKRMPDAARGLGRSLRIFKSEIKGLNDDDQAQQAQQAQAAQQAQQSQTAPQGQLPAGYQNQPVQAPAYPGQPVQAPAYPGQPVYQQPTYPQPTYPPAAHVPAAAGTGSARGSAGGPGAVCRAARVALAPTG